MELAVQKKSEKFEFFLKKINKNKKRKRSKELNIYLKQK